MTDNPGYVNATHSVDGKPPPPDGSDLNTSGLKIHQIVSRTCLDATTGKTIPYPTLITAYDLHRWSSWLEREFKSRGVPEASWPDAAIHFLLDTKPQLSLAMQRRRVERMRGFEAAGISYVWNWEAFLGDVKEALGELGSIAAGLQSAIHGGSTTDLFSAFQSIASTAAVPIASSISTAAGAFIDVAIRLGSGISDPEGEDPGHGDGADREGGRTEGDPRVE